LASKQEAMEIFFLPKEAVLLEFKRVNGSNWVAYTVSHGGINQSALLFSYIGKIFK
jgi:hypothetical protein